MNQHRDQQEIRSPDSGGQATREVDTKITSPAARQSKTNSAAQTQRDRQRAAALLVLGLGPVTNLVPDAVYFTSRI